MWSTFELQPLLFTCLKGKAELGACSQISSLLQKKSSKEGQFGQGILQSFSYNQGEATEEPFSNTSYLLCALDSKYLLNCM